MFYYARKKINSQLKNMKMMKENCWNKIHKIENKKQKILKKK